MQIISPERPKVTFSEINIGRNNTKVYISVNKNVQRERVKLFNQELSRIDNVDVNESHLSLIKQNISMVQQQRMNLSTEENSYQTNHVPKREHTANISTRTDEDISTSKRNQITEESRMQPKDNDKAFARFFSQEEYDPLLQNSTLGEQEFLTNANNRSRAYVTTAPLHNKRVMVDRKERVDEIRDFKNMNKSMLTLFR